MNTIIEQAEEDIYADRLPNRITLAKLVTVDTVDDLYAAADRIRERCAGDQADICSIINARSGKCSENCTYCAQSSLYQTGCACHGMISETETLKLARIDQVAGVKRFSLVTSGRSLEGEDFSRAAALITKLGKKTDLELCASFGILDTEKLCILKKCGLTTYHHNLETGRNYFSNICTTHTYDDRIRTVRAALKAGLDVCSGGIIGLGESMADRIDMALELRQLGVLSVPVNVLHPIQGTPLEHAKRLEPEEILRTLAVFRFILPAAYIRLAGGREALPDNGRKAFLSGANALISGDFLTTTGSSIRSDLAMLRDCGFSI